MKTFRLTIWAASLLILLFGLLMTGHGLFATTYDLEPDYARGLDIVIGLGIAGFGALLGGLAFLFKNKSGNN